MMTDAEIMEQVRSGAVLKYCGRGVVVINYGWWVKLLEKTGFRIVPTLEDMMADRTTVIDALERCARLQDAPMSGECAGCAYKENFGTCGSLSKLMMDAAELLKKSPTVGGWTSVKDRLPEENLEYLVYATDEDGERVVTTDHWNKYVRQWYIFENGSSTTVTHWMPLPEPPEEDDND